MRAGDRVQLGAVDDGSEGGIDLSERCATCGAPLEQWQWLCSACGAPVSPDRRAEQAGSEGGSGAPIGSDEAPIRPRRPIAWILVALVGAAAVLGAVFASAGPGGGGGGISTPAGFTSTPQVSALGGDSPITTAIEISKEGWPGGAPAAVLVSVEDSSAAAVAGPLAAAAGGPVLLSSPGGVDAAVLQRLVELGAKRVYVLDSGGYSAGYGTGIEAKGLAATAVRGADRVGLALAVAQEARKLTGLNGYVIVPFDGTTRGVVSGGFASAKSMPVLFAGSDGNLKPYRGLLAAVPPKVVTICATQSVVPDAALKGEEFDGALIDRVDGTDDQEFSRVFAEYAFAHGFEYKKTLAVRASLIAHAYSASAFGALTGSPLIITDDTELGTSATGFFVAHASSIGVVRFIGPSGPDVEGLLARTRQASETRISPAAVALDESAAAKVTGVTSGTVTFVADAAIEASVVVGKILVSGVSANAPCGFLRRVTAVRHAGADIVADTEPASLGDVILKGSFDVRVSGDASAAPSVASLPQAIQLAVTSPKAESGLPAQGNGPAGLREVANQVRQRTESEHIRVPLNWPELVFATPEFSMPPDIGGKGKVKVHVTAKEAWEVWYVMSGTWDEKPAIWGFKQEKQVEFGIVAYLRHNFDLDYEVELAIDWQHKDPKTSVRDILGKTVAQSLDKQAKGPSVSARTVFMVYVIPVVLDSYIEPSFGVKGSFKGVLKGSYSKHIDVWVGARVRLESGEVIPVIGAADRTPPIKPPTFEGELEVRLAGGLKVGTRFYGVIGPYMRGELYFKVAVKDTVPPGTPPMTLALGVEGTVGGDLKILTWDLGSIEFEPAKYEFWVWPDPHAPPSSPATPTPSPGGGAAGSTSAATSLVFDVSTSMGEQSGGDTKLNAAKAAGQTVLDVIGANAGSGAAVGVATFSAGSESVLVPTDDIGAVRSAISGLSIHGNTDMLAGIRVGIDQLAGSTAPDKAILYLSDGMDTAGNSPESIIAAANDAAASGIKIYTIGFGDQGLLDEPLLKNIADATGGTYGYADASAAMSLVGQFTKSQVVRTGATPLFETTGAVGQGQTADMGVATMPKVHGDLQVVLAWPGSDMDVRLVDPSGAVIASGYPGLTITKTARTAQVTVAGAKPGDWQLSVVGVQTSSAQEPFYTLAAFRETSETPVPTRGGAGTAGDGSEALILIGVLAVLGVGTAVYLSRKRESGVVAAHVGSGSPGRSGDGGRIRELVSETGRRHPLKVGANAIGRALDNDLVIDDPSVSRYHALLLVEAARLTLRDLDSSGGSRVNGSSVREAAVVDGDELTFGEANLRLQSNENPTT